MKPRNCHLCGSQFCQAPFCRFFRNEEEARMDQESFTQQWQEAERRLQEQDKGYRE